MIQKSITIKTLRSWSWNFEKYLKNFAKSIDLQTFGCHNLYMNLFENVIDNKVIDNLSNEQVDMLLEILKDI